MARSRDAQACPTAADHPRALLAAALVGFSAAILLCGYEFIRSPADALFPRAFGKEALPYGMAITPLAVLLILYVYGRVLSRIGPRRTLSLTTLVSAIVLAGCFAGVSRGWRPAVGFLYVFREAYVVLLIEQYWSFLNSTLGTTAAKRLNGPVCGLASIGAIAGASLVAGFAAKLGPAPLILAGAALTVPAGPLMEAAYRLCGEPRPGAHEGRRGDALGLRLFGRVGMLPILLVVILLTQAIAALLYLNVQSITSGAIGGLNDQTAYWGGLYRNINIASFVLQFGITPLVLRYVALGAVHVTIPLIHVASCLYLLASPSLASASIAFLLFKSIDYSTFRAAKEILYIPLSFDARYRAKEVIDVFGYRVGKGGASLAISGVKAAGMMISDVGLAIGALAAAGVWAGLAVPLVRAYRQGMEQQPPAAVVAVDEPQA